MMRTLNLRLPFLLILCLALTAAQSWVHAAGRDEVVLYHTDILGTAVAAFDENHNLCWSESYTPYGDKTVGSDTIPRVGCGLVGEERGYTGHTEDYSTDLVYMQQRYYDPSIGRFLSVDPISPNPADSRTFNRYSYAANNPYKFVDPTGELFFLAPALAFVAKEVVAEVASRVTNGATDVLSARRMLTRGVKAAAKRLAKKGENKPKRDSSNATAADVTKGLADPKTIRFSQDSISSTFRDGRSVKDLAAGLKNGSIKPSDVPAIRTVQRNGQTVSIDNRRLAAFREAGVQIRTRPATAKEISQAQRQGKFSAGASGTDDIRIRGQ